MKLKRGFPLFILFVCWLLPSESFAQFTVPFLENARKDSLQKPHKVTWSLLPEMYYSPETSVGVLIGGNFIFNNLKNPESQHLSKLIVVARYSLKGQVAFSVLPEFYMARERLLLRGLLSVGFMPYSFWGIGPDTKSSNRENYNKKYLRFRVNGSWAVLPSLYVGAGYKYYHYNITGRKDGGILETDHVEGWNQAIVTGPSMHLLYDTRDNNIVTHKGALIQFDSEFIYGMFGSTSNYTKITVDARKYFQINKKHTLALNLYSQSGIGIVPFEDMAAIGGSTYMRGYLTDRYLDNTSIALQAEYRWYFNRFGFSVFGGIGDVGTDVVNALWGMNKCAGGIGGRYFLDKKKKSLLRVDVAYGRNGFEFYFGLGELF